MSAHTLFGVNKGYIDLGEWVGISTVRTLLARVEVLGMFHLREEENQEPGKQVLIWREEVEPVI